MPDAVTDAEVNMQSRLSGTHNTKRGRLMQENLAEQTGDRKNLTIVKRRKTTTMGQAAKGTVH